MGEPIDGTFTEEADSNSGVKFFRGICFGFLFSIPLWVIMGLVIRFYWLA